MVGLRIQVGFQIAPAAGGQLGFRARLPLQGSLPDAAGKVPLRLAGIVPLEIAHAPLQQGLFSEAVLQTKARRALGVVAIECQSVQHSLCWERSSRIARLPSQLVSRTRLVCDSQRPGSAVEVVNTARDVIVRRTSLLRFGI